MHPYDTTKRCTKCGETKPQSDFHRNRTSKDGLAHECKVCRCALGRQHNANLTEEGKERKRQLARGYLAAQRVSVSVPDLPDEEWRDVVGLEGLYMVSNLGRVKALPQSYGGVSNRRREYLIKAYPDIHGYPKVHLAKDGTKPHIFVHRLVAAAFIGPCPDGHEVNHLDGVHDNYRLDNLEYVTPSGNIRHRIDVLGIKTNPPHRIGANANKAKLTDEQVTEIRRLAAIGDQTYRQIGALFGVAKSTVKNIVSGRQWRHLL